MRKSFEIIKWTDDRIVEWKRSRPWIWFLLPSLLGVIIFFAIPYLDVLRRAFWDSSGSFVGFSNFAYVLSNQAFQLAVKNSLVFTMICIPLLLTISLAVALLIYNKSGIGSYLKTGLLIPIAIPVAAVVVVWKVFFSDRGILNAILDVANIGAVDWMNSHYALAILVGSYIWKNLGYHVVLWLAGLSLIPENLYEAARLDRASRLATFIHITFPNLRPMVVIVSILAVINSFKVFREAYLVAGNYPHESIYMVQHLFNNWFRELALDKMAAGAVMVSSVLVALVFLLEKAWGDWDER